MADRHVRVGATLEPHDALRQAGEDLLVGESLERVLIGAPGGGLADDRQDGDRGAVGLEQRRRQVGGARSTDAGADRQPVRRARVAVGHEGTGTLVVHDHRPDPVLAQARVESLRVVHAEDLGDTCVA
ncbi:MAG: hypothetical protein U0S48_18150 [Solirubrobacteraceae bacterium]